MYKISQKELSQATNDQLENLTVDPNVSNIGEVAAFLAKSREAEQLRREHIRAELQNNPLDPRREITADARYIVKNLWIIFVALPFVLGILYYILK